ncbi:MAG: hypothetical protein IPO02_11790 [Bacteroidetes bacterium]|nr:hypothetical protein [Bacteroidota bacterium]
MEIIKVDIQTKANLTLLAKAYWEKLFPLATYGKLYYEQDLSNYNFPVRFLYFMVDYYEELIQHLENIETLRKIEFSNNSSEWFDLISTLKNNKQNVSVDIGKLNVYTPSNTNYEFKQFDDLQFETIIAQPKISSLELDNIINEIELDLKRIYIGIDIGINSFEKGKGISIHIPLKIDIVQRFSFKPIIQILNKYDQIIEDFKLFKGENKNDIWVSITIKEW